MISQIPKIKLLFISSLFFLNASQAQSLIQKFVENTFVLSDSNKSNDGYYFGKVDYNLKEHFILMINAIGDGQSCRPMFIVKGSTEKAPENLPTLTYIDTSYYRETNAVYIINKTDNYTIIVANSRNGEKGIIKTKMGLGNTEWLEDDGIFPTNKNFPFSLAFAKLLRHAIFNFKLITGGKQFYGEDHHIDLNLPNAIMKDFNTKQASFQDLNMNMKASYYFGAIYRLNNFDYQSTKTNSGDLVFDQKDTAIALAKYESLKLLLTNSLPLDFSLEREVNFPLYSEFKDEYLVKKMDKELFFPTKATKLLLTRAINFILCSPVIKLR